MLERLGLCGHDAAKKGTGVEDALKAVERSLNTLRRLQPDQRTHQKGVSPIGIASPKKADTVAGTQSYGDLTRLHQHLELKCVQKERTLTEAEKVDAEVDAILATMSRDLPPAPRRDELTIEMLQRQPGAQKGFKAPRGITSGGVLQDTVQDQRLTLRYRGHDPALKPSPEMQKDSELLNEYGFSPADIKECKRQAKQLYRKWISQPGGKPSSDYQEAQLRREAFRNVTEIMIAAKQGEKSLAELPEEQAIAAEEAINAKFLNSPAGKAMLYGLGATGYGAGAVLKMMGAKGLAALLFTLLWGQAGATGTCYVTNYVEGAFIQNRDMLNRLCLAVVGQPGAAQAIGNLGSLSQGTPDQLNLVAQPCLEGAHTQTGGTCNLVVDGGPSLSVNPATTTTTTTTTASPQSQVPPPPPPPPGVTTALPLTTLPPGSVPAGSPTTVSTINPTTGLVTQATTRLFTTVDGTTLRQTTTTTIDLSTLQSTAASSSTPPDPAQATTLAPSSSTTIEVVPDVSSTGDPVVVGTSDAPDVGSTPASSVGSDKTSSSAISNELAAVLIALACFLAVMLAIGLIAYCRSPRFKAWVNDLCGRCTGKTVPGDRADAFMNPTYEQRGVQLVGVDNPLYGQTPLIAPEHQRRLVAKIRGSQEPMSGRRKHLAPQYVSIRTNEIQFHMLSAEGRNLLGQTTQVAGEAYFYPDVNYMLNPGQFTAVKTCCAEAEHYLKPGLGLLENQPPRFDQLSTFGVYIMKEVCRVGRDGRDLPVPVNPEPQPIDSPLDPGFYEEPDGFGGDYLQIDTYEEPGQGDITRRYQSIRDQHDYEYARCMPNALQTEDHYMSPKSLPSRGDQIWMGDQHFIFHGNSDEDAVWVRWTQEIELSYEPLYDNQGQDDLYGTYESKGDVVVDAPYDLGSGSQTVYDLGSGSDKDRIYCRAAAIATA